MERQYHSQPEAFLVTELTQKLLNKETPAASLHNELQVLSNLFAQLSGFDVKNTDSLSQGETNTSSGLAVSPSMAAMCSQDICRSVIFLRGLYEAIKQAQQTYPHQIIRVLYIGCGPYALQATPLMSIFPPQQVRFSLLDIHDSNLAAVSNLIDKLGFNDSVSELVCMDAVDYQINEKAAPHVVTLEIMQSCLRAEPQVTVSRHIMSQAPNAKLVPEDISIELRMADSGADQAIDKKPGQEYIHEKLGTAFSLNKDTITQWTDKQENWLPGATLTLPENYQGYFSPSLFTKITVFADNVLQNYESGLTIPRPLSLYCDDKPGKQVEFSYQLGDDPQIRVNLV